MKNLCFVLLLCIPIAWMSCDNPKTENAVEQTNTNSTNKMYSCPMHPEIKSDKQGTCPKCGMDLEGIKIPVVNDSTKK